MAANVHDNTVQVIEVFYEREKSFLKNRKFQSYTVFTRIQLDFFSEILHIKVYLKSRLQGLYTTLRKLHLSTLSCL